MFVASVLGITEAGDVTLPGITGTPDGCKVYGKTWATGKIWYATSERIGTLCQVDGLFWHSEAVHAAAVRARRVRRDARLSREAHSAWVAAYDARVAARKRVRVSVARSPRELPAAGAPFPRDAADAPIGSCRYCWADGARCIHHAK